MSNLARLVLLSGTGGSGTTTLVDATASSAHDEGLRAVIIDALAPRVDMRIRTSVESVARAFVDGLAADPLPIEAWSGLDAARHLAAWDTILDAMEEEVDVVIVDCGNLRESQALVQFPATLRRLLDALHTPSLAMRGPSAGDGEVGGTGVFSDVEALRDRVAAAAALVESPQTTMRLVTVPEAASITRTLHAQSMLALLGVQVEAMIVNRCARKSDDVSREQLTRQQAELDRVERSAAGSWVWKSSSTLRPIPKDRSVVGPLGGVVVLRAEDLEPRADEESFLLTVPLVGEAATRATVGRCGDDLVVAFDGAFRWLPLPSVLRRCRALEAVRTDDGLVISFEPDAALWRPAAGPEQAA